MAVLDLDHLKKIVGDDPAFLRQVLQIFIRNAPQDMGEMAQHVEAGDHEKVGFFAHKLKSASGAIGYNQAYNDFKEVEAMAKDMAPMEDIQTVTDRLAQECAACMVDIEKIMNEL